MAAKRMTATTRAATKASAAATTATTAKKVAPTPKAGPAKKVAPTPKAAPAKKVAPTPKAGPAKKAAPAKKVAPTPKAAPAKKAAPANKAALAKKAAPTTSAPATTSTAPRARAAAKGTTASTKQVVGGKPATVKQAAPARTILKKPVAKKSGPVPKAAPSAKRVGKATAATAATSTMTGTAAPLNRAGSGSDSGPARPRVAQSEKPWTATELREIRTELESERSRALADLRIAETDLQGLLTNAGEGAGDDQADAGASIFGREYEMVLAYNSRERLEQIEHALERLTDGGYGVCESCGNAIGKIRLQAAPRATLCLACKTKQESR